MPRSKKDKFLDFRLQVQSCSKCPYSSVRENPIRGNGEYRSPILLISNAPRKRDDTENTVYSGRAGRKLERMLQGAELDVNKIYRTCLVRCYSGREPKFGEFSAFRRCQPHTVSLIKLMNPIAVIVSGYKAFKWLILRWTSEVVDEHGFYRWIGKSVRLKEVWNETKFFIIQSPGALSNKRDPEAEAKSIEALIEMKKYVVSKQRNEPLALEMVDLKRRPHTRTQQQTFGWS